MRTVITFLLNAGLNFAVGLSIAAVLGPAGYGHFAVAASAGALIATGLFDWLRLSTTRFYGEPQRLLSPALRPTLDFAYRGLTLLVLCGTALVICVGIDPFLTRGLVIAVAVTGIANGAFDFQAALARARFKDRDYAVLVIGKGVLGLAFALGAALLTEDPALVLAAQAGGILLATLPVRSKLLDPPGARAESALLRRFASYGVPVVVANVVFQTMLLCNRSAAASHFGYASAGQLSLATDIALRLLLAMGAAVDVFVFQLAVRAEATEGHAAAERQLRVNMVTVSAVLVLLAVGFALTLPAFVALIVPARFRSDFVPLGLTILPGILLFCLGQFAVNPVFQIAHRTAPIVGAALVSAAVDGAGLLLMPVGAGPIGIAALHSASLAVGFVILLGLAMRTPAVRPPFGDIVGILVAAAVTSVGLWPMRAIPSPILSLILAASIGPCLYGALLFALDVGTIRAEAARWAIRIKRRASVPEPV
ncbi:lipopolysaccharide biosynthesis protein [Lichenifustis flavocetrariae]|uniref:Lipopolysaccharide biosynthesis protein n=1 Tax=Lichenifustis flavocetrariae TaxID=2949735 RepID=A0AA41YUG4_9HYPH|nr:lipopolysaccharide biosynthesis protein [Lichenifustis flavocetrariae]MCW6507252.1 lipopolysaccharide biosynthesis protein [Lichenifustis flavocetrariae]